MPVTRDVVATPLQACAQLDDLRLLVRRGEVRPAVAGLRALHARARTRPLASGDHALMLAMLMDCLLAQGDLDAALRTGDELSPYLNAPAGAATALARWARGELSSALGQPDLAVEHFLAAGAVGVDVAVVGGSLLPWRSGAALALVRDGRRAEALALADEQLGLARAQGDAHDVALALRALATIAPDAQRVVRLREAAALLADGASARLQAQIDTDLAGLLVLSGQSAEALTLLRGAESYAGRHGLWPLQGRVRRLLDRLGEAPCRPEAEVLALLTPGERRVALLIADGLTNRQVAEQLGVSVKAVEGHLSKVYRKLGLSSRAALHAVVAGG